jgi:NAD(P)H-dependent FMN reductase
MNLLIFKKLIFQCSTSQRSEISSRGDGYIFVTPEYNAGYPAALKNAIDYLYHEWTGKPAMIISYGAGGGASAGHQLHEILTRLKFNTVNDVMNIVIPREILNEDGQIKDPAENLKEHGKALETIGKQLIDLVNTNVAA